MLTTALHLQEKNPQEQEACDDSETPKEKALDSLFEDPKKNPLNLPVEELLSKIQNDAPVLNVDSILRVVIEYAPNVDVCPDSFRMHSDSVC